MACRPWDGGPFHLSGFLLLTGGLLKVPMPACVLNPLSCPLFATLWTVAHQTPLSMGYPRQEYWSELPFPFPGDLPNPEVEPVSPAAPALQADSLLPSPLGSPKALMLSSKRTGYPLLSISLKGRRLGWYETLLVSEAEDPDPRVCVLPFSSPSSSSKVESGEGHVALPLVQHTISPPTEHTSPSYRLTSKGLFRVGEKSYHPRAPGKGRLLVFPKSPQLEPVLRLNIWLGKRKMYVPSIFPSLFPLLPRRP